MRNTSDPVARPIHPVSIRVLHWINATAIVLMIGSGLGIHNADPILPGPVPATLTVGGDLIGALRWHLAMMWVVVGSGIAYLAIGLATGRFRRKLWPISITGVLHDTRAALTGRLGHEDLTKYNQVQRLLYAGVIMVGAMAVLSGLALWKPVQLAPLVMLLGDFDIARLVHFGCMALITGFLLIHAAMALLVPRSMVLMTLGGVR